MATCHGSDFFDTSVHSGPACSAVKMGASNNGRSVPNKAPRLMASTTDSPGVRGGATNNGRPVDGTQGRQAPSKHINGSGMPSSAPLKAGEGQNGKLVVKGKNKRG